MALIKCGGGKAPNEMIDYGLELTASKSFSVKAGDLIYTAYYSGADNMQYTNAVSVANKSSSASGGTNFFRILEASSDGTVTLTITGNVNLYYAQFR